MIELSPGPELDAAVAKAIGWHRGTVDSDAMRFWWDDRGMKRAEHSKFHPSADLNCAFEAAERAGLFDRCDHILSRGSADDPRGPWWVNHTRYRDSELSKESVVAAGPTPALAICAAILKLNGAIIIPASDQSHETITGRLDAMGGMNE